MKASGAGAVMASRREPPDSLDFFPTPPWATRALCEHALPRLNAHNLAPGGKLLGSVKEPCCGEGHMAGPLADYAEEISASDIFPYGYGGVEDYLAGANPYCDWHVFNPPFNRAIDFTLKAIGEARVGVAVFVRNQWLEGEDRYARLFQKFPPTAIAHFVERVSLCKGRWAINSRSATAYSWIVWMQLSGTLRRLDPATLWIPPGRKRALTRHSDFETYGACSDLPSEMQKKIDAYEDEQRRLAA